MQIIRDNQLSGLLMIPLLSGRRCNIKDCTNTPTTVVRELITDSGDIAPDFCLCEEHYTTSVETGRIVATLEFI